MFRRFVSGIAIPSIVIPFGALFVLVVPAATQERIYPLTVVWCFVPAVWGVWAMMAPAGWVPQRLPLWGAILGVIAGFLGVFVLNIPSRISGETLPTALSGVAVLLTVLFYYFLWMLVRAAYRSLGPPATVV